MSISAGSSVVEPTFAFKGYPSPTRQEKGVILPPLSPMRKGVVGGKSVGRLSSLLTRYSDLPPFAIEIINVIEALSKKMVIHTTSAFRFSKAIVYNLSSSYKEGSKAICMQVAAKAHQLESNIETQLGALSEQITIAELEVSHAFSAHQQAQKSSQVALANFNNANEQSWGKISATRERFSQFQSKVAAISLALQCPMKVSSDSLQQADNNLKARRETEEALAAIARALDALVIDLYFPEEGASVIKERGNFFSFSKPNLTAICEQAGAFAQEEFEKYKKCSEQEQQYLQLCDAKKGHLRSLQVNKASLLENKKILDGQKQKLQELSTFIANALEGDSLERFILIEDSPSLGEASHLVVEEEPSTPPEEVRSWA